MATKVALAPRRSTRQVQHAFRTLYPHIRRWPLPIRPLRLRRVRIRPRCGIAVAQVVGNNTQWVITPQTSVAVTLTVSGGSVLCVWGSWGGNTTSAVSPTSISDTQGGTYFDGQYLQDTTVVQSGVKYFRLNTSAGALTVTLTFPSSGFSALYVAEITGSAGILDGSNANLIGTASTATDGMSCGPIVNTFGPALSIGFCSSFGEVAQPTHGTGFTPQLTDTTTFSLVESQRFASTGTNITPTFTTSVGPGFDGYLGAFVFLESTPTSVYRSQEVTAISTPPTGTTIAVTLNVTAGSFLHVYSNGDFKTALTMTITDSQGQGPSGSYTNLDTVHDATIDNVLMQQAFVKNSFTGALTVTCTYSTTTTSRCITVFEIKNATGTAPDVHSSNNQTPGTTATNGTTSGSVTVSGNGLLLALSCFLSATAAELGTVPGNPGTGFTPSINAWAGNVSFLSAVPEYSLVAAGANAATFTAAQSHGTVTFIAIYDGPTGAPTFASRNAGGGSLIGSRGGGRRLAG